MVFNFFFPFLCDIHSFFFTLDEVVAVRCLTVFNCARYSELILNDKCLKMSDFPIINPQKHLFSFMWIYQRNNRLGINIKKSLGIFLLHRFYLCFFKGYAFVCILDIILNNYGNSYFGHSYNENMYY